MHPWPAISLQHGWTGQRLSDELSDNSRACTPPASGIHAHHFDGATEVPAGR
jgi:hypothetical protein